MPNSSGPISPPLLAVSGLTKVFRTGGPLGKKGQVVAVDNVTFEIRRGECVALVGESGSGKSTIARLILRLATPNAGSIRLNGDDVLQSEPRGASLAYRSQVQMVFQDPFGSLNPAHTVAYHLSRPLSRHRRAARAQLRERILDLLNRVGLAPAEEYIDRHPYELSGGQRQRVAIARALAVEPQMLIADEPTSMLDVSIRMDVLNLLRRLKEESNLAILLITHDLASARYLADRILVLNQGKVVEGGTAEEVVESPKHPYTVQLLSAIADAWRPLDAGAAS